MEDERSGGRMRGPHLARLMERRTHGVVSTASGEKNGGESETEGGRVIL